MSLNFKDDQDLKNFLKANIPTAPNAPSAKQEDEFNNILLNVQQYKRSKRNKTIGTFSGVIVAMLCLVIVVFPTNKGVILTKTIPAQTSTAAAIPSTTSQILDEDENNYYPAIDVGAEYFSIMDDKI